MAVYSTTKKEKGPVGEGAAPPNPRRSRFGFSGRNQQELGGEGWFGGAGCGGGGGRIVAASEMLRPSVEHFQQAEVMPEVAKSSLTV